MIRVLVFLFVLLVACTDEPCTDSPSPEPGAFVDWSKIRCEYPTSCAPVRFCADVAADLPESWKSEVETAGKDWEASTRGMVVFGREEPCQHFGVVKTNEDDPWFEANQAPRYARAYTDGGAIHLNEDHLCGSASRHAVIRHEMGHVIGLSHIIDLDALMYPKYLPEYSKLAVRTLDVQAYVDLRQCCPP